MFSVALLVWVVAACPPGERFVETGVVPAGALTLVAPAPRPPLAPGCVAAELGTDCAFIDDDQRRFEAERRRLSSARVLGPARVVDGGVCLPPRPEKQETWLRTPLGHWAIPGAPGALRIPRKRGSTPLQLQHVELHGAPAGAEVLFLPSAQVVRADGGFLALETLEPIDSISLVGTRASTSRVSRDGGTLLVELQVLPSQGPVVEVRGARGPVTAFVHGWTREAGAYDPELSTRRPVALREGLGRLPTLEPQLSEDEPIVHVVEAVSGGLVGAARAHANAERITVTLARPARLRLPAGHDVVEWRLAEALPGPSESACDQQGQPWRQGKVKPGKPLTLEVPAGPGRCLMLMRRQADGTTSPWSVAVPSAGSTLDVTPPPDEE